MKLPYLIAAFFIISACGTGEKVETVVPEIVYHQVLDTVITFNPETLEEKIKIVRYEITDEEMKERQRTEAENKRLAAEKAGVYKSTMEIVKNEETGEVDTIVTFSLEEIK